MLPILPAPLAAAKGRLCAACGMCCDGTMFELVRLQPGDSRKELSALGLKLKHKGGATCFQQPCAAFRGSHCAIYAQRPERCRRFECRQLELLSAGETTEPRALERIGSARERVVQIQGLLSQLGAHRSGRRLQQRCEDALAQAVEAFEHPESARILGELAAAMRALEDLLETEFRVAAEAGGSAIAAQNPGGSRK